MQNVFMTGKDGLEYNYTNILHSTISFMLYKIPRIYIPQADCTSPGESSLAKYQLRALQGLETSKFSYKTDH